MLEEQRLSCQLRTKFESSVNLRWVETCRDFLKLELDYGSVGASKSVRIQNSIEITLPLIMSQNNLDSSSLSTSMATPVILGVSVVAAAILGRSMMRRGLLGGKAAADQWVKGGFKAKMDRKEAIEILGLKCVASAYFSITCVYVFN